MRRATKPFHWLLIAALALSPLTLAAPTVQAATETPAAPYVFAATADSKGEVAVEFQYPGTLAAGQSVDVLIGSSEGKQIEYKGKLTAGRKSLTIKGLREGESYSFNIKVSHNKEEIDSFAGQLILQIKRDENGNITAANVQLGDTMHRRLATTGEVSAMLNVNETESNGSFASANTLVAGDDLFGKISSSSDVDYFKVSFGTGGVARFWLGAVPDGTDYDIEVYDSANTLLRSSLKGSNSDEIITNLPVTAGSTYYVKVKGYNGTYNTNLSYNLQATHSTTPDTDSDSYERNDTFAGALTVQNNNSYLNANLHTGSDQDFYRFYVPLRSTFSLDLTNIPVGTDYDVSLYNASQGLVGYSQLSSNSNEQIQMTLDPGYYYAKVYPYTGASTANYTLSLKTKTIPVILFPGIGGSQLMANGELTWFNLWDALLINAPLKNNLELVPACSGCTGVVQKNSGVTVTPNLNHYGLEGITYLSSVQLDLASYYRDLISDLTQAGYVPGKTLYGFPYDWRLDNRAHQQRLTDTINQALSTSGATKVQAVAHSMGGLVMKDYLLNQPAMTTKIDQVTTVGTPFLGAALASKALAFGGYNFGIPIVFDSTGEAISKNAPAVYQLAPSAEYEKQIKAQLGRSAYRYIDIWGNTTDYTHAQLNAKYPNSALAGLADTRHGQWDLSYPGVKQHHIIGDAQSTVTAYNYWEMKDIFHWFYLEYVMAKGDGTVPLLSANKPGTNASFYYSSADHVALVKDQATRTKIVNIVKGQPNISVAGIRTSAASELLPELTAQSLTGTPESFSNMTVELKNKKTGLTETVKFYADGTLDAEHSTASLQPQAARLQDGKQNLQFFINKFTDYDIVVKSDDGTEFIVAKYDIAETGTHDRYVYGNLQNQTSAPLTIRQTTGNTAVYQGANAVQGQPLHMAGE
ncbi:hypothetical protein OS242_07175 [Tumebacillus sp. DT12]|uniref:Uncharacterized protein n=1 Tax=Tumebacillus lacus TaxID=2995335 RepID=A0ABT3X195_9BACL|nr:hypothetical protein [Tumebacillus lacus]MCX7569742.1 hypothetical protein [Tumebacillus lacus]